MSRSTRGLSSAALKIAMLTSLALLAVATLLGWSHFGTAILLDAAASGLSWCF